MDHYKEAVLRDMCEKSGRWIEGGDLIRQRISRILLTPKGSKPVMRSFGSNLCRYVGLPQPEFKLYATQEIFEKLELFLPEVSCETVEFIGTSEGKVEIIIKCKANKVEITHVISP